MELYQNDDMFAELCSQMYEYYRHRSSKLKERDAKKRAGSRLVSQERYAWHDALYR